MLCPCSEPTSQVNCCVEAMLPQRLHHQLRVIASSAQDDNGSLLIQGAGLSSLPTIQLRYFI